jgi:hypothetical protein
MQAAIVMLMALSGLGCQNKPADLTDLPPVLAPASSAESPAPEAPTTETTTTPPPYPRYFPETYPDIEDLYSTHLGIMTATLYSFVFGHDPGIASAQEIEASVLGPEGDH